MRPWSEKARGTAARCFGFVAFVGRTDRSGHLAVHRGANDHHSVLGEVASDDSARILEALSDIGRGVARILDLLEEDDDEAEAAEEEDS